MGSDFQGFLLCYKRGKGCLRGSRRLSELFGIQGGKKHFELKHFYNSLSYSLPSNVSHEFEYVAAGVVNSIEGISVALAIKISTSLRFPHFHR